MNSRENERARERERERARVYTRLRLLARTPMPRARAYTLLGVVYSSSFILPCGGSRGLSRTRAQRARGLGAMTSIFYPLLISMLPPPPLPPLPPHPPLPPSIHLSFGHLYTPPLVLVPLVNSLGSPARRFAPRTPAALAIRFAGKRACASGTFEKE